MLGVVKTGHVALMVARQANMCSCEEQSNLLHSMQLTKLGASFRPLKSILTCCKSEQKLHAD